MDHTKELILNAHKGDKKARDQLILENMGLVYSVSKRFLGRGLDIDDINQIGTIGLIKAIDRFDAENFDVMFSTYAVPMITGEIRRFLRDDGMIKVSRSLKENGYRISKACEEITGKLGRAATAGEIAQYLGISVDDVILAMDANSEVDSIYRTVYQSDGNEIYLLDKLSGENSIYSGSGEGAQEKLIDTIVLKQAFLKLTEDEKELIGLRYYREMTQKAVAERMGISQVQVSRKEKRIIGKMKSFMNEDSKNGKNYTSPKKC